VLHYLDADPIWIFVAAALAIIPLAGVLGDATEALSIYSGPTLGGIVNATMGNATELIIAFFALPSALHARSRGREHDHAVHRRGRVDHAGRL
jgi:calcium/proton exchanger cax